jgi:hypothetical protein
MFIFMVISMLMLPIYQNDSLASGYENSFPCVI